MLPAYKDIRSRIPEEPLWFDAEGVPRYDPFHRDMLGVYDRYAIYATIACQACGKKFNVGVGYTRFDLPSLKETDIEREAKHFHYGDPPRHEDARGKGGCSGDTMNCDDLYIREVWDGDIRLTFLEGPIDD